MGCYGPLTAFRPDPAKAPDGRLVFDKKMALTGVPMKIPCGKCPGCRLEHSRQWAIRCMHEKRLHTRSSFVTLTYDDKHLPQNYSLVKADLQNFMKRLRHEYEGPTRFFACGEYGSNTSRPHYHLLLLNQDFADKRLVKSGSKYNLYDSSRLSKLWTFGQHSLGDVTFESAAYTARYCMKKRQNGKTTSDGRVPEFIVMSRRPGLGTGYFDRFRDEIISHDSIIVNGYPNALPRYYDSKLGELTGFSDQIGLYTKMELIKIKRRRRLTFSARQDNTLRRLRTKELVMLAKLRLKGETL